MSELDPTIDPNLPLADIAVLENLLHAEPGDDTRTISKLKELEKEPTLFTTFTGRLIPDHVLSAYKSWAITVVRNPLDVVFLTHIILYFTTSIPSAIFLYLYPSKIYGVFHWIMQLSYTGSFTLMMHNHIHNNGILKKKYAWLDQSFPIILEPMMGHTWHSYYYHHVKMHHVENNGPDDLSSTLRYQRDSPLHFLFYLSRFLFLIWAELPIYFFRKSQPLNAIKAFSWEIASYILIITLFKYHPVATTFAFVLPFVQLRLGLMLGNFGQHALLDHDSPESDFRSSITLIDVPSNRDCFNDGYHTSHHLNPKRHWREHPRKFVEQKGRYSEEKALIFRDVDYLMVTLRLLMRDYTGLAKRMVPLGEQKMLTLNEKEELLRQRTKRFDEEDIGRLFPVKEKSNRAKKA